MSERRNLIIALPLWGQSFRCVRPEDLEHTSLNIQNSSTVSLFKRKLKTFLFDKFLILFIYFFFL